MKYLIIKNDVCFTALSKKQPNAEIMNFPPTHTKILRYLFLMESRVYLKMGNFRIRDCIREA